MNEVNIMTQKEEFVDLLKKRRKDCDIAWVSRPTQFLKPHKLPPAISFSRKQTIDAALANPKVLGVIKVLSDSKGIPESVLLKEAEGMLHEMASKSHLPTVRWLGLLITKVLKRILVSIEINESWLYTMKNEMNITSVQYVYAPTHRSYLDFILLSYILFSYDMSLPNIASGMDFYKMKIVGELLRHTGAFYIRRTFSTDPLYKEIFRAYVNLLVSNSEKAIEFFIEGTRSRSQKTLSPKFGLLSTILEGLFKSTVPDIQFIPISISYDKPLEELLFVYELLGVPKPAESTKGLFRSLSILENPFAYGNVFVKIAPPISARKYLNRSVRKMSALSPHCRLPHSVSKDLGYALIDCHKKNTILTAFNLIALLYNESMYAKGRRSSSYNLQQLLNDYRWIKNVMMNKFEVTVNPKEENISDLDENVDKREVLESLTTHKNLITIDGSQNLHLLHRHMGVSRLTGIKGHSLKEETLQIAVPVVNLMIYVNPNLAFLAKPAMAAMCMKDNQLVGAKGYLTLRSLLSTEFALLTDITELEVMEEWKNLVEFLNLEDCTKRLNSLLCNVLTPFVISLHTVCKVLLEWDASDKINDSKLIKECQRYTEECLYIEESLIKHPYSLTLDVYTTSLTSLAKYGYILIQGSGTYFVNKESLESVVHILDDILKDCSTSLYMNDQLFFKPSSVLAAKL